jgi:hypothetical protein
MPPPCPSLARAKLSGTPVHHSNSCAWPAFSCPHTPPWQLFSTCCHRTDAETAALWRVVRGPFRIPLALGIGHRCQWELIDHHLAGCTLCGKVHRCDSEQCSEIFAGDSAYAAYLREVQSGMRCPCETMDDGSAVCRITGICIRTKAFGVEYEVANHQGFTYEQVCNATDPGSHELQSSAAEPPPSPTSAPPPPPPSSAPSSAPPSASAATRPPPPEKRRRKNARVGGGGPATAAGVPFTVNPRAMRGDFVEQKVRSCMWTLLRIVSQNESALAARHADCCEKRNALLDDILCAHRDAHPGVPVCMLSVAASLENAFARDIDENPLGNVVCLRNPFQYLTPWLDEDIEAIVERVFPPIYRLFSVLRTLDSNKYKGNNLQWMVLGMLYICTTGMVVGNVRILPKVLGLRTILPNLNRIKVYFASLRISTRCVTDMSNMITVSLKDHTGALRALDGGI